MAIAIRNLFCHLEIQQKLLTGGGVVPGPLHGARQVAHPARQHHGAAQRHELNRDIVYRETLGHVGFNTFEFLSFDYDFISTVVFIILWPKGLEIVTPYRNDESQAKDDCKLC